MPPLHAHNTNHEINRPSSHINPLSLSNDKIIEHLYIHSSMTQRLHQTFKDKSTPTYPQLEERKLKGVHERSRSLPFVTSQRQKSNPAKIGYGNH